MRNSFSYIRIYTHFYIYDHTTVLYMVRPIRGNLARPPKGRTKEWVT